MADDVQMAQTAPFPHALKELVDECKYRRGWRVTLQSIDRGQGSMGLTLTITAIVQDSLDQDQTIGVNHLFIVPAASYNRRSWMRWLLDRFLDVESHEACEYFRIGGERVYAPHHSEGENPYTIFEIGDFETANKRFTDR